MLYLSYKSPIGIINVGYQIDGAWGAVFGDNSTPAAKIVYIFVNGGLMVGLQAGQVQRR